MNRASPSGSESFVSTLITTAAASAVAALSFRAAGGLIVRGTVLP
jgi:hypothetical protein